ncbi:MAG TPA: ORF6N domain-containing protein [Verrucomicrobiae bacterium]|nr:ORF6N domain-containing protein [Verrucomicrobiae bacterium]
MANDPTAVVQRIESLILTIRSLRVMLDSDLARIYGVPTMRLNEQVKRNLHRFPVDFAFQLTREEFADLISHFAISKPSRGGRTKLPWVFTEHGAIMLASVLNSPIAVDASVRVVRAFVYLREQLLANRELARKFAELEKRLDAHDESIAAVFEAIRRLLEPPAVEESKREIGFHLREQAPPYRVKVHRRR